MKFNRRKNSIKIATAILAVSLMAGTAFAKPEQQMPYQYQPAQDSGPSSQNYNKPGQDQYQGQNQSHNQDRKGYNIQEMRYSKGGNLQIKINNPDNNAIRWDNNQRVVVRDSRGRTYNARINRTNRNVIELIIANLVFGEKYSAEIYGLDQSDRNYRISGDFWAKDNWRYNQNYNQRSLEIQKIIYNGSGKLRIKLYNPRDYNIRWNNDVRVTVRDSRGRDYNARILRTNKNSVELAIRDIRNGQKYSVEINGVRYNNRYSAVTTSFWAVKNWTYER